LFIECQTGIEKLNLRIELIPHSV